MKNDFNIGDAMRLRTGEAVKKAGGKDALFERVISAVFPVVKDASISQMRKLGGYSQLILAEIGEPPAPVMNSLQIPTSAEYWVWSFLRYNVGTLREMLQIEVANYRRGNRRAS
jgi:hypothetical protein